MILPSSLSELQVLRSDLILGLLCILVVGLFVCTSDSSSADTQAPYIPPPLFDANASQHHEGQNVIQEPAAPALVNGKPVTDMNDGELHEFLEQKIRTVEQSDGQVEVLHIAPGYALTLHFEENIEGVVIGDPNLVSQKLHGQRVLILSATQREGDTSITILMPGGKTLHYHIFISPDFTTADTNVRVTSRASQAGSSAASSAPTIGHSNAAETIGVKSMLNIVSNYDVLVQEKSVSAREVHRVDIYRFNRITSFTTYYLYHFSSGFSVLTFSYRNPFPYRVQYDESRLRIQIGDIQLIPEYTTLHQTKLAPHHSTSGVTLIRHPAMHVDQPFALFWK